MQPRTAPHSLHTARIGPSYGPCGSAEQNALKKAFSSPTGSTHPLRTRRRGNRTLPSGFTLSGVGSGAPIDPVKARPNHGRFPRLQKPTQTKQEEEPEKKLNLASRGRPGTLRRSFHKRTSSPNRSSLSGPLGHRRFHRSVSIYKLLLAVRKSSAKMESFSIF